MPSVANIFFLIFRTINDDPLSSNTNIGSEDSGKWWRSMTKDNVYSDIIQHIKTKPTIFLRNGQTK